MTFNPERYQPCHVVDTCAVWNVLSSRTLYFAAIAAGCGFCITRFVEYECLQKHRTNPTLPELALQQLLLGERRLARFKTYEISLDDLVELEVLEKRRRLGLGELSAMIFAKKTRQALLTDDQGARRLAGDTYPALPVQTTPHLFGYLLFHGYLSDSDNEAVKSEHVANGGGELATYFQRIYLSALEFRSVARK